MRSIMMDYTQNKMDQTQELLRDLRAWAKQRHGNQALLRETLGVSKQAVSAWVTGRSAPNFETGLKLRAFLKSHKAPKPRKQRKQPT
jgi:DNA-binding XRE family transcriptional regulator